MPDSNIRELDRVKDNPVKDPAMEYPKVGIGVMVMKNDKVLMGMRIGSHGENQYSWPGGHMNYMESFEDTAKREVMEESGLEIKNVRFLFLNNMKEYAPKHFVDIGLTAKWASGKPTVLEPDKRINWGWYDLNDLPTPYFVTVPLYIEALRTGRNFFDQ